jgi:hypothetical protein
VAEVEAIIGRNPPRFIAGKHVRRRDPEGRLSIVARVA